MCKEWCQIFLTSEWCQINVQIFILKHTYTCNLMDKNQCCLPKLIFSSWSYSFNMFDKVKLLSNVWMSSMQKMHVFTLTYKNRDFKCLDFWYNSFSSQTYESICNLNLYLSRIILSFTIRCPNVFESSRRKNNIV